MSSDSDIDGLTTEEEKIYGTKVDKPDSDEDGYKDGSEVVNGYNPMGEGNIEDSEFAEVYNNEENNYTLIYPTQWITESIDADGKNIVFTPNEMASAGEFIEVIVEANPYGFSAQEWYLDQNKDYVASQVDEIEVSGLDAVLSVDGYTVYFANSNYIYAITYNFGSKDKVDFISTYKMMYKSFKLQKAKKKSAKDEDAEDEEEDSNSNSNSNENANTNSN